MVRVMREPQFRIHRGQRAKLASRSEIKKSNISLKGRQKKPVKLAPLKFLEYNKDEKPKSA